MKIKIFNRHSLGIAVLLLFFFTGFYSCKKIDTPTAKQLYAAKFFEKPAASSPGLQAIIDLLRTENHKTGFVNTLPGNAGLPVWNKTIYEKPKPNYAARGVLVDQNGNYLIPLSNDTKTLSALLFAMKKDGKYEFYCYDNNYAYQIAYNDKYSVKQRENIMGLFMSMSNYVFGITQFKSIPIGLFVGMNGEKIEEGGKTKQMFLEPPKGIPPIILNSLGVIGTEETCVYKFSGQCNCGPDVVTNTSHCNDWWLGCPFCSVSDCQLLIFEEVPGIDSPPTNPNGGTGGTPSNGYPSWGEGQNLAGGPLTAPTNGSLPNAPCSNNCAWYTETSEQEFETEPPVLPALCNMTCEEAQQLLNAVTGFDTPDDLQMNYGAEIVDPEGVIRKPVAPVQGLVTLNLGWGLNPPHYSAFFQGVIYKRNTTDTWKWESCTYNYTAMDGGSLPPCFGITHNVNVSPVVISADKREATSYISFQFYGKPSCLGGLVDPQLIYKGGDRTYHLSMGL